ncbi:MAG: type IV pilus modification PilV family protein [Bacteriovoracia bacterium]
MHKKLKQKNKGFTLIEILISIAILVAIISLVGAFQADVFSLNGIIQSGLQNQSEAKKIIRPFANEVRSAAPSNLGSYPLIETASTTFSFYSDTDSDGLREMIKYSLDDGTFKKTSITPTGQPLEYDVDNEETIQVIEDVTNTDIFTYYDSNYDGATSSNPLPQPVTNSDVRLVKINLIIDSDPNKPPEPIEITTQVSIRNLKDNL